MSAGEALSIARQAGVSVRLLPGGLLLDGPPAACARMAALLGPVALEIAALLRQDAPAHDQGEGAR